MMNKHMQREGQGRLAELQSAAPLHLVCLSALLSEVLITYPRTTSSSHSSFTLQRTETVHVHGLAWFSHFSHSHGTPVLIGSWYSE